VPLWIRVEDMKATAKTRRREDRREERERRIRGEGVIAC
jgi:hypothetical protein